MRTHRWKFLVLSLTLLLPCGCGGGGGGDGDGDFSLADIVGSWQGPTASVTVDGDHFLAAGPTGFVVDAAGDAVGAGASNREGTLSLISSSQGIYRFVGTGTSAGQISMLIMSVDKNHLLWVDNNLGFGAWERNATEFGGQYADADLQDETWIGLAAGSTAAMNPIDPQEILVAVDVVGNFTAGTTSTNVEPLVNIDALKGSFDGDFTDSGPPATFGNVVVLMTRDKNFIAIFSCLAGGAFPADCTYAALSR